MIELQSQKIKFEFSNSDISSNGGVFLYADFLKRIDLEERLRQSVSFPGYSWMKHEPAHVISQKILSLLAGYEDDVDARDLKADPVYQQTLRNLIASQSTLSRVEHAADRTTIVGLYDLNLELLHQQWQAEGRKKIALDVDSSDIAVYGRQPGSSYHGYYGATIYHPLYVFAGESGDLIRATLRQGNVSSAHALVRVLTPIVEQLLAWGYEVSLRGDSGMADPLVYAWCEKWGVVYHIRLKMNGILSKIAPELLPLLPADQRADAARYATGNYQARSWNTPRRVHFTQVYRPGQLFPEYYAIVTNNAQETAEEGFLYYHQRGTSENFIKESHLDCGFRRLSCDTFLANAFRLQVAALAYNVNNLFRRNILPEPLQNHHLCTLRAKLIKVGCRIVRHARQLICQFGRSFKIKKLFAAIIAALKGFRLACAGP